MANSLKFGGGQWATKEGSALAYNDENGNFKPLPFDFTRASKATVINKNGLIEEVGSGQPRIDFLGNTKGALLLEPSRTNKISTSNDFNGVGWLASSLTATANQVVSPDGNLNASKLEMTGNGSLRSLTEASFNNGYAYSIFVKKGNSRYVTIRSAFFTQSIIVGFDLDTLSAQTNGKIEDYGNDWYRLSISKNISGDADKSGYFYLYLPDSLGDQTSVSGNNAYFYGGQLEEGYPTSYIKTEGSTVTRLADNCNNGGNEQVINSSEGVLYAEISALADDQTNRRITLSDGTNANRVVTGYNTTSNQIFYFIIVNNSNVASGSYTSSDITQFSKIAIKYKEQNHSLWVDGVERHTDTSGATFSANTLSSLQFEQGSGGALFLLGKTKDLRVYNTALTDAELAALTS